MGSGAASKLRASTEGEIYAAAQELSPEEKGRLISALLQQGSVVIGGNADPETGTAVQADPSAEAKAKASAEDIVSPRAIAVDAEGSPELYIICNRGTGGMFKVNPTDSKPNNNDPVLKDGWKNATATAQLNGKNYVICGKGGGRLYEIDPEKKSYKDVCGGWNNADFMVGCGDFLYIICNRGGGGMYKVNPTDSKPNSNDRFTHGWKNATAMAQLNGKIYVICGKGGGGLYEVDPEKNSYSDAEGHVVGGWHNADFFCSISGGGKANDGIWMDTKPLYVLEERDFAFDVGHYGDAIKLDKYNGKATAGGSILLVPKGTAMTTHAGYGSWVYFNGRKSGKDKLIAPSQPGEYEIRILSNYPGNFTYVGPSIPIKVVAKA